MKTFIQSVNAITKAIDSTDFFHRRNIKPQTSNFPQFIVIPETPGQIAHILKIANKEKFPIFVLGQCSEIEWNTINNNGIFLSTEKLKNDLILHKDDFIAEIDCGFTGTEIFTECNKNKFFYPFRGFNYQTSTLGGNYSSGNEAPFDHYYGNILNNVLGIEFITPDGNRVRFGGKTLKNATGYNFPRILYGTRGRLGIVTKLFIKIFPHRKILTFNIKAGNQKIISFFKAIQEAFEEPVALIINRENAFIEVLIPDEKEQFISDRLHLFSKSQELELNHTIQSYKTNWNNHFNRDSDIIFIKSAFWGNLRTNLSSHINSIFNKFNNNTYLTLFGSQGKYYLYTSLFIEKPSNENTVKNQYENYREIISSLKGIILYSRILGNTEHTINLKNESSSYFFKLKRYFDPENILNPI